MNSPLLTLTPASVIFFAMIALSAIGLLGARQVIERSLFRPYWLVRKEQYDTLILSGFVHADFPHLLFNAITFYSFGFLLQQRIGGTMFAVLYLVGLLVSDLETFRKHRNNPDYATLGASGAISAVLFASIVYYPGLSLYLFLIPIPIPALLFAVGYLAYTYYAARHPHGRINHDAHLGGAMTGLLFVAVTEPGAYGNLLHMF